jgi:hypothetical protein
MMSLLKRTLIGALAGGTFLVTGFGMGLVVGVMEWAPPSLPEAAVPVYVFALLGVPAAVAVWVARRLAKKWQTPLWPPSVRRPSRCLLWALAAAYALTAMVGIPAAQNERTSWAISEYKRLRASDSRLISDAHPYIRTYVSIPVLPGVILSYHEYQLDGLYGLGSFELALWYWVGTRSLRVMPVWIS